jgi:hypothetical protein
VGKPAPGAAAKPSKSTAAGKARAAAKAAQLTSFFGVKRTASGASASDAADASEGDEDDGRSNDSASSRGLSLLVPGFPGPSASGSTAAPAALGGLGGAGAGKSIMDVLRPYNNSAALAPQTGVGAAGGRAGGSASASSAAALVVGQKRSREAMEYGGGGGFVAAGYAGLGAGRAAGTPARTQGVWVGTVHASKGREWHTVFVINATEGLLPLRHPGQEYTAAATYAKYDADARGGGAAAVDPRAYLAEQEERRLAYVALSRARKQLVCLHAVQYRETAGGGGGGGSVLPEAGLGGGGGDVPEGWQVDERRSQRSSYLDEVVAEAPPGTVAELEYDGTTLRPAARHLPNVGAAASGAASSAGAAGAGSAAAAVVAPQREFVAASATAAAALLDAEMDAACAAMAAAEAALVTAASGVAAALGTGDGTSHARCEPSTVTVLPPTAHAADASGAASTSVSGTAAAAGAVPHSVAEAGGNASSAEANYDAESAQAAQAVQDARAADAVPDPRGAGVPSPARPLSQRGAGDAAGQAASPARAVAASQPGAAGGVVGGARDEGTRACTAGSPAAGARMVLSYEDEVVDL